MNPVMNSIMKRFAVCLALVTFVQVMLVHPALHRLQSLVCACDSEHDACDGHAVCLAPADDCPSCQLALSPFESASAPAALNAAPPESLPPAGPPERIDGCLSAYEPTQPRAPPAAA
jgi:hypothetical protein